MTYSLTIAFLIYSNIHMDDRSEGNAPSVSPAHLGPREPAGVPGLVFHPLRLPMAAWVLGVWEGGVRKSGVKWEETLGDRRMGGSTASIFPDNLGPGEPAELLGMILPNPRPEALRGCLWLL